MELGDKLRQARIQAGLSQRELCGDTITRNMLSQIEHGTASPSIATLRELAGRLGKPVGYFFEEDMFLSPNRSLVDAAGEAMDQGKFTEAARILKGYREPDPVYDRLHTLMLLICLLNMARQAVEEQRQIFARELLDRAEQQEQKILFPIPGLHQQRMQLLDRLDGTGEVWEELPPIDERLMTRAVRALRQQNWDQAARFLEAMEDRTGPKWDLCRGQAWLGEQNWEQAAQCLHRAEAAYPRETARALEQCYRELEDYRQAYFYACKQK